MANESSSTERAPVSPPAAQVREMQPTIEPPSLQPIYTNFARVMGSPEELILDFGLNTDPMGAANTPIKISERLVMNYFTAKRLWAALGVSLKRQEATFGVLETDVTKRVVTQVPQTAPR